MSYVYFEVTPSASVYSLSSPHLSTTLVSVLVVAPSVVLLVVGLPEAES